MTPEKEKGTTAYLYDTRVENIFIGEYLPEVPGDYVKVYLYGLMAAERNESAETVDMARALHFSEDQVEKAVAFLADLGLLRRAGGTLIFTNLKEQLYGKPAKREPEPEAENLYPELLDNRAIAEMAGKIQDITGRFLTAADNQTLIAWLSDYRVDPDLVTKAFEYSYARGGKNLKYVGKVIAGWASEGLISRADVEDYLQERDERYHLRRRVMQALGFRRMPTEEEARLIDSWPEEQNATMQEILDACAKTAGIGNPNIRYVDAVIRGRRKDQEKGPGRNVVMAYYAALREEAEENAARAREEVYLKVPRIRAIDEETVAKSQQMTELLLTGDVRKGEGLDQIRGELSLLDEEKARLLTEHGIPVDYMKKRYRCPICQDTGVLETGGLCECYVKRAQEAAVWEPRS